MKPYNKAACCGVDCGYHGTIGQPCWGDVEVVDEVQFANDDYGWIHACEGHRNVYDGGKYIPPNLTYE